MDLQDEISVVDDYVKKLRVHLIRAKDSSDSEEICDHLNRIKNWAWSLYYELREEGY